MHSTNLGLHNESLALGLERSVRRAGRGSILTDRTSFYIVAGLDQTYFLDIDVEVPHPPSKVVKKFFFKTSFPFKTNLTIGEF